MSRMEGRTDLPPGPLPSGKGNGGGGEGAHKGRPYGGGGGERVGRAELLQFRGLGERRADAVGYMDMKEAVS